MTALIDLRHIAGSKALTSTFLGLQTRGLSPEGSELLRVGAKVSIKFGGSEAEGRPTIRPYAINAITRPSPPLNIIVMISRY